MEKFFRTLFWSDIGPENRINLFETFPKIKSFFYNRKNFAILRSLGDIIFLILILLGLFGPQNPKGNIMLFISWGIWWPTVVISWFFLGRFWCALCPFPGLARLFQKIKFSLYKPPSKWLQNKGIHLATILFFLIIWLESTTSLVYSPRYTAFFLLSIVLLAGVFGIIYREYAWCRFLCPLGRITGVASVMSMIEFRPNYQICTTCKEAHCRKGTEKLKPCPVYLGAISVRNNLNCFICGHCLLLCPKDSPAIYLRHPLSEIILNKGKGVTCAFIIPFLIGSQLARFLIETPIYQNWLKLINFPNTIFFTILFFFLSFTLILLSKFGALLFKHTEDPLFGKFNLTIAILIPFAFTGELIYRINFFLKNLGDFIPFQISLTIIKALDFWLIALSLLGSLYLIFYFYYKDFAKEIPFKNYLHFIFFSFFVFLSYSYLIFNSI